MRRSPIFTVFWWICKQTYDVNIISLFDSMPLPRCFQYTICFASLYTKYILWFDCASWFSCPYTKVNECTWSASPHFSRMLHCQCRNWEGHGRHWSVLKHNKMRLSMNQGLNALSERTSYYKISWSLEAARFVFTLFQSLWNLTGSSAAALSNFRAIWLLYHQISWRRDFTRLGGKTSYLLVNKGPGWWSMEWHCIWCWHVDSQYYGC